MVLYVFMTTYYSGDKIKEVEMGGTCSMHRDMSNAYKILVGKSLERGRL
jgi:hypothetical protein